MRFVLDASAGLYVAASRDGFAGLGDHQLDAPQLFWSETLAGLRQALRRGVISAELAERALSQLRGTRVTGHRDQEMYARAWDFALRAGWAKTYDAEYVALAAILGVPLLTRDERLARGARRFVEVASPVDL